MFPSTSYLSDKYNFLSLNPEYKNEDLRRHERNQEILTKIQELKVKASVFAERSEKYRQIKDEYKFLLQKYSPNLEEKYRTSDSQLHNIGQRDTDCYSKKDPTSVFSELRQPLSESNFPKIYASVGVNTELTGPVKSVKLCHNFDDTKAKEKFLDFPVRKKVSVSEEAPSKEDCIYAARNKPEELKKDNERRFPEHDTEKRSELTSKLKRLDISVTSTSESLDTSTHDEKARDKKVPVTTAVHAIEQLLALTDETSFDTTTSAAITKKSETNTSAVTVSQARQKEIFPSSFVESGINMNMKAAIMPLPVEEENIVIEPLTTLNESPTTSVGDSVMDSIYNKMPEAIPDDEFVGIEQKLEDFEEEKNKIDSEKDRSKSFEENQIVGIPENAKCQESEGIKAQNLISNASEMGLKNIDPALHSNFLVYKNEEEILDVQEDPLIVRAHNNDRLTANDSSPVPSADNSYSWKAKKPQPVNNVKVTKLKVDYEDSESEASPKRNVQQDMPVVKESSDDLDDFFDI